MRFEVNRKAIAFIQLIVAYKEEFIDFAKNADVFICECSLHLGQDGKPFGHMNSVDAATIAQKANVRSLSPYSFSTFW
ncbi:hypothetical protein KHA80_17215 [Anaerobacillus sp. HL2]|nr:hypothetical protein KHA80_17215 [Anaerobacillus sp. HL2]